MSSSTPENATSRSWHRLPEPAHKAELGYAGVFSRQDLERIRVGHVATSMEDKWFIYLEDGWLRFRRSWTGACIYGLKIRTTDQGGHVVDSWVNRDTKQHKQNDTEHDRRLVEFLIGAFLLRTVGVAFPMPRNSDGLPKGVLQHSAVRRGYPETKTEVDQVVQPAAEHLGTCRLPQSMARRDSAPGYEAAEEQRAHPAEPSSPPRPA